MSLFTADSPVLKVEGLETKFDSAIVSNSLVIFLGGNYAAARILQQLHYCSHAEYGVVIDGVRWIYKPVREIHSEMLVGFTTWQIRQAIAFLVSLGVIRKEHLYAAHHGHNYAPKNRTLYYTVVYERIEELVNEFFQNPKNAETVANSGFASTANPICESFAEAICAHSKTNTNKTSIQNNQRKQEKNPSPTPPFDSPQKSKPGPQLKIRTRPKTQSEIPIPNTNAHSGGGDSSPNSPIDKPINQEKGTQPKVKLSDVIARPKKLNVGHKAVEIKASSADVDEKINNKNTCTIRQAVQEVVQSIDVPQVEVVQDVQEPVQQQFVEESTSDPVESPPEPQPTTQRPKTPRGTKPRKRVYENALWKTIEERNQFERELTHRVVNGVGKARNPMALVRYVMNQITQGISHPYWEEWISGVVIGSCETQEWEASPGHPYPKFVEYLIEKLKYDGESRSQAQFRLGKILDDVSKARIHWREFKRIIEGMGQDGDKAAANGQQVALPTWFIDRAEISLKRAAESAQKLSELAPEQTDWVYRGLPESEKLLTAAANSLQPGIPEIPPGQKQLESKPSEIKVIADPWTDVDNNEEDENFCFNGFIDMGYLEQRAKKVAGKPEKLEYVLVDFQSALAQATQKQKYLIRERIEPICPELFDFL